MFIISINHFRDFSKTINEATKGNVTMYGIKIQSNYTLIVLKEVEAFLTYLILFLCV